MESEMRHNMKLTKLILTNAKPGCALKITSYVRRSSPSHAASSSRCMCYTWLRSGVELSRHLLLIIALGSRAIIQLFSQNVIKCPTDLIASVTTRGISAAPALYDARQTMQNSKCVVGYDFLNLTHN